MDKKIIRGFVPSLLTAIAALAIIAAFAFTVTDVSLAQVTGEVGTYREPVSNFKFDFAGTLVKFIFSTIVCIAIILAAKSFIKPSVYGGDTDNIKVIDYKALSHDKYIFVVEIFEKIYILAFGGGGAAKVDEIKDRDAIEAIRMKSDKNIKGKLFSEYLKKFMPPEKNN